MFRNKIAISILLFVSTLVNFGSVYSQEVRVNCNNLTMSVPSANDICYQIKTSDYAVIEDTSNIQSDTGEILNTNALDPSLETIQIANTALHITDYEAAGKLNPEVTLYKVDELALVNTQLFSIASDLINLLNNISSGITDITSISSPLPFLPYQAKTQLVAALPKSISCTNGTGIRTLTAFGNSGDPVSNTNLLYSFQGITTDGQQYISAVIPVSCSEIEGVDTTAFDWHILADSSCTPVLSTLDTMMESIVIE